MPTATPRLSTTSATGLLTPHTTCLAMIPYLEIERSWSSYLYFLFLTLSPSQLIKCQSCEWQTFCRPSPCWSHHNLIGMIPVTSSENLVYYDPCLTKSIPLSKWLTPTPINFRYQQLYILRSSMRFNAQIKWNGNGNKANLAWSAATSFWSLKH